MYHIAIWHAGDDKILAPFKVGDLSEEDGILA